MKIDAEELVDAIRSLGLTPRSYSGRCMYGKTCVSVNLDSDGEMWDLAIDLAARDMTPGAPTTDGMGRGIVAYWPSIAWPEGRSDPDDFDDDDEA